MDNKSKLSLSIFYLSFLTFIAFAAYILYANQEVFYTAHDRSEFLVGSQFFNTLMSKPFGLVQYAGAWLTQLFCKPIVGTCVLVTIWALIYFTGVKAFRLKGNASALMLVPIACLLTSVVDTGYWIYVLVIRGYWFSQSVGYLLMLTLLWIARCTPRKWHLAWYLIGMFLYPILGWFSLLFVLCLVLMDDLTWREALGVFLLLFTASIWRTQLYSNLKSDDVMFAGFPVFETPSDKSEYLSTPFWVLGAATILIALCRRYLSHVAVPVLCSLAGIIFTWTFMFQDKNYVEEMRMRHCAENDDWKGVLQLASANPSPTISMIALKNVALMHEGGLLDRSFKMGNNGTSIHNPESINVGFLEIASSVVYYNYGMFNEAFRLTFECAVQTGFSPFYLKMLSRCALANGEKALVERYNYMLHGLPFYSDWKPAPAKETVNELHKSIADEIAGVENTYSFIINQICFWNGADNKAVAEQALFYSMMRCNSRRFWQSLRNYVQTHMDGTFPPEAQEAYIMYMDKAPEEKRMMIPVDQKIYDRYKKFWSDLEGLASGGTKKETIQNRMRQEYGDTYWYYNIFAQKNF